MRVLITFSKTGALKYIGHLDLQAIWERAVRRAGLPLAYSNAFHPQPKIYFASALPLGFTSRCEVVDLRFSQDVDLPGLPERLQAVMPSGIGILNANSVDESGPALQTQLIAAEYEVTLTETTVIPESSVLVAPSAAPIVEYLENVTVFKKSPISSNVISSRYAHLTQQVEELLAKASLLRERRGKAYDLRPLIEKLEARSENKIFMRLTAREAATGRPEEVLDALGIPIEDARIERTRLIFQG